MQVLEQDKAVLYANFNQDHTRICVGTRAGFKVFAVDPFDLINQSDKSGGCSIVETLFDTKLVFIVGSDDMGSFTSRRLKSWNIRMNAMIHQTMFPTPVLAMRMNRTHVIVVRETMIHVYDMSMKLLAEIETPSNPRGVVALTSNASAARPVLLAYPSRVDKGDMIIYDLLSLVEKRTVNVHKERLRFIQFSPDDTLIATASETGSFIKVIGTDAADTRQWHFRRGFSSASIDYISFNYDQTMLACSSTNGTIHIFRFPAPGGGENHADASSLVDGSPPVQQSGLLGGVLLGGSPTAYFSSFIDSGIRSAATIKIPQGLHALCGFSRDSTRVFSVTSDGKFSAWQIDFGGHSSKLVQERDLLLEGRKMQTDSDSEGNDSSSTMDGDADVHDGSQILM